MALTTLSWIASSAQRPPVEKLQAANASPSFGRDQTRSAFRWYAVDRGLGLRRATTCHITTDRNHTRKRALKAPLRTSVFTAWSLHKEHTQPAPVWQVSLLGTGSGDPGVLAMTAGSGGLPAVTSGCGLMATPGVGGTSSLRAPEGCEAIQITSSAGGFTTISRID
jgi:hypothetical protein